jgi:EmrB/QacA subfamily drug resistance transporter
VRFIMQRKWRVALIVSSGVFMASLDLFIVNLAFPAIAAHFGGASLSSLSWILSGYAIVFAALLVPAGRWADAFGRKRAFLIGLSLFVLASVGAALAPSVTALTCARLVQAAGGALMLPTSLGLMLPEFGPSERHLAIGVWAATGGVAAAAGPPLGGLLVQVDWRLVFLVNVPVGVLGLVAGTRTLHERRELGAGRPDLVGALAFMLAVGALVVAIVKGQEWGWTSPRVLALLAASAALAPAIWWRCKRHPSPLLEPSMLRVRSFRLAVGGSLLFFAGFGAMLLSGVLFLTSVWHESVLTAGLMLAPGPAMASIFSVPSARLGARFGFRLPGVTGGLLVAAGSLWYIARTGAQPAYAADFLPGIIVGGAGVGLVIPTLFGAGASSLAPARFATGAAVLTMGRQVGAALGVAILVAVLDASAGGVASFHAAWLITVIGGLATALVLAALGPARAGAPGLDAPAADTPVAAPAVEGAVAESAT